MMVKFHLFCVLTLCACLGKICAGNDETLNVIEVEKIVRQIYGVGEQFVDDAVKIFEKYQNNYYVIEILGETIDMLKRKIPKERNSKLDANQLQDFRSKVIRSGAILIDELKIWQSILSKQLPPERYNGIVNVLFTCVSEYPTTEETLSALNYLYGVDAEATETSFLDAHNITNPAISGESDCPLNHLLVTSTINELRNLVGIRPKVLHDVSAIRETFPCNGLVRRTLKNFVYIIKALDGDESKINACMIKESPGNWDRIPRTKVYLEQVLEGSESVLSTRLPDKTIRGIINFKRATLPDAPIDEIEKSLEYLYEDVPKTVCSTTESSTEAK